MFFIGEIELNGKQVFIKQKNQAIPFWCGAEYY